MSIADLKINGLFGRVNYSLNFENNNIVIITGPNGYGKTMILKIINSIINNNLVDLIKIKFVSIELSLSSQKKISIKKIKGELEVTILNHEFFHGPFSIKYISEKKDNDFFFISQEGEKIDLKVNKTTRNATNKNHMKGVPENIYNQFFKNNDVTFIKDQRLQCTDNKNLKIDQISNDLINKIKKATQEVSQISLSLDSSFPTRLMEKLMGRTTFSQFHNAMDRLIGLKAIRSNLTKYGLINPDDNLPNINELRYDESLGPYSDVLNLYVDDAIEKTKPYDTLSKKINLFSGILEDSCFSFKTIKVDKDKGFYFVDDINNDEIALNELSSGEQNQIIIYYEMIFNSDENSVVLLDEPEISLHVAWQKNLLSYIEEIIELNGISQIVIATHSPSVISTRWDYVIDLMENNS